MKIETTERPTDSNYVNSDFEVFTLDQAGDSLDSIRPWQTNIKYLFIGIAFGILLIKSEVVSWFRIQEMFRFQSFHMYGIIGSAIVVGIISILLIKKFDIKSIDGERIKLLPKRFQQGQVIGGLLFGLGWAITGACPGPLFAQIGSGATVVTITLLSAIGGTWVYGFIRDRLPH
jgi:uncharacterized membrane protein YedE/YeeE